MLFLLLSAAVGRAQVNRRLAMDCLKIGTDELEAGDLDAALVQFQRAIELNPNYGAAYFSRGLVRKQQQDYDAAISDFTRSIALKPMAEAYLNRGATLRDRRVSKNSARRQTMPFCCNNSAIAWRLA